MRDITLRAPVIAFLKAQSGVAVLRDTDSLADWLDRLYDAQIADWAGIFHNPDYHTL